MELIKIILIIMVFGGGVGLINNAFKEDSTIWKLPVFLIIVCFSSLLLGFVLEHNDENTQKMHYIPKIKVTQTSDSTCKIDTLYYVKVKK